MTTDDCISGRGRACTAGENVTLGQSLGAGGGGSCCFMDPSVWLGAGVGAWRVRRMSGGMCVSRLDWVPAGRRKKPSGLPRASDRRSEAPQPRGSRLPRCLPPRATGSWVLKAAGVEPATQAPFGQGARHWTPAQLEGGGTREEPARVRVLVLDPP